MAKVTEMIAGFETFLKDRQLAPENQMTFYVRWLKKYVEFVKINRIVSRKESVLKFLDELAKNSALEDWQINQAKEALQIFYSNFMRSRSGGGGELTKSDEQSCLRLVEALRYANCFLIG